MMQIKVTNDILREAAGAAHSWCRSGIEDYCDWHTTWSQTITLIPEEPT